MPFINCIFRVPALLRTRREGEEGSTESLGHMQISSNCGERVVFWMVPDAGIYGGQK